MRTNSTITGDNKNPSVYGTGTSSLSSDPPSGSQCIDIETIWTAGTLLRTLSESNEMRLYFLEDMSSRDSDHMRMLDQSGDCPKLVEAVRILDSAELIDLEDYQWLPLDRILLTYGPGDGFKMQ